MIQTSPPENKENDSSTYDLICLMSSQCQTIENEQSDVSTLTETNLHDLRDQAVNTVKVAGLEVGLQVVMKPRVFSISSQTDLIPELMNKRLGDAKVRRTMLGGSRFTRPHHMSIAGFDEDMLKEARANIRQSRRAGAFSIANHTDVNNSFARPRDLPLVQELDVESVESLRRSGNLNKSNFSSILDSQIIDSHPKCMFCKDQFPGKTDKDKLQMKKNMLRQLQKPKETKEEEYFKMCLLSF